MKLNVNGKDHDVDAPADMPLLWVLRDVLGLTGTKFGCGIAQCGACTVHVDGEALRSCVTAGVARRGGQKITTIEGLSADGSHPVQRAWTELDVAAVRLLPVGPDHGGGGAARSKARSPTRRRDRRRDDGNLCRCGTYQRIRAAVHRAPRLAKAGGRVMSAIAPDPPRLPQGRRRDAGGGLVDRPSSCRPARRLRAGSRGGGARSARAQRLPAHRAPTTASPSCSRTRRWARASGPRCRC